MNNPLLRNAYVYEDGTGYYYDCSKCHFYKNDRVGECRNIACDGQVIRVEFHITEP